MALQILRILILILLPVYTVAQDSAQRISMDYFDALSRKAGSLEANLDKETDKVLQRFARQEAKMRRKLSKIDSLSAKKIFSDAEDKYRKLKEQLSGSMEITQYVPRIDTLLTSFKFLEQNKELLTEIRNGKDKIGEAFGKVKDLESQLQKAETIKQFLKERRQYLKEQLSKFGFSKEIQRLNKELFYYSEQLKECKEILNDSKKVERKAIELLSKTKEFQSFMQKNSMLASMFNIPGAGANAPSNAGGLAGLQTRTQVSSLIQGQLSANGPNAQQIFSQNLQAAQVQLRQLKDKVNQFGGGSSEDIMPDGFNPNDLKTKNFLERLEIGTSFQTRKATNFFPIGSDIGFFIGYKFSEKGIFGVGASYKVSWGSSWNNVRVTHEGVGLRSFVDWKLKGSFWLSGGYEQNYLTEIRNIPQLKDRSLWKASGLIGISKVLPLNNKLFNKTKVQLLWDFLASQNLPKTQPIIFRLGYNLK